MAIHGDAPLLSWQLKNCSCYPFLDAQPPNLEPMSEDPEKRPFYTVVPLLFSQTIGAFNDNAMKALLPAMAALEISKESMKEVNSQVGLLLILPFVIFAPLAGWVSDRFPKKKVVSVTLLAQLLGLGLLSYQSCRVQRCSSIYLSRRYCRTDRLSGKCIFHQSAVGYHGGAFYQHMFDTDGCARGQGIGGLVENGSWIKNGYVCVGSGLNAAFACHDRSDLFQALCRCGGHFVQGAHQTQRAFIPDVMSEHTGEGACPPRMRRIANEGYAVARYHDIWL